MFTIQRLNEYKKPDFNQGDLIQNIGIIIQTAIFSMYIENIVTYKYK